MTPSARAGLRLRRDTLLVAVGADLRRGRAEADFDPMDEFTLEW